ncbi:LamG domain-containing protein [Candidatus Woesearchaeota archaeon]|nr:LamG domain-containing protein [Candidatus Woesearchaeota archaeon]
MVIMLASIVNATTIIDDTDSNWNSGTQRGFQVLGIGGAANLSSTNTSGHFASQIFDSVNTNANWTNITLTTEVPYQTDLEDLKNENLTLLMHFDNSTSENDTYFADFSQYNNFGSCSGTGCPLINKTTYKFGKAALWFDGTNDWVNLSDVDVQNSGAGYSVEVWAKHTATSFRFLVGKRDSGTSNGEWSFSINNAGNDLAFNTWVSGGTNDNLQSPSVGINDNNWHYLVATFSVSDGVKKIYVDGVQVATSTTTSGTPAGTSASLMIGQVQQYYGSVDYWYNNVLDEVAIWNMTLENTTIREHALRGTYKLNLSVRSCDDALCSGETYTSILTNASNNKTFMNLAKNRYFQYNITYSNESSYGVRLNVNNVSISYFNVVVDTTKPIINGTLNKPTSNIVQNDIINASFNVTDEIGLNFGQIVINDTGVKKFFNFTLSGTADEFNQIFTINCGIGCVVNLTGIARDTSNNLQQNTTIFTVASSCV